jgi:hypothetical protein
LAVPEAPSSSSRPYKTVAFRFNQCSTRFVAAFAEDYRVEATPEGCRFLSNLRRYTDKRFATTLHG